MVWEECEKCLICFVTSIQKDLLSAYWAGPGMMLVKKPVISVLFCPFFPLANKLNIGILNNLPRIVQSVSAKT